MTIVVRFYSTSLLSRLWLHVYGKWLYFCCGTRKRIDAITVSTVIVNSVIVVCAFCVRVEPVNSRKEINKVFCILYRSLPQRRKDRMKIET